MPTCPLFALPFLAVKPPRTAPPTTAPPVRHGSILLNAGLDRIPLRSKIGRAGNASLLQRRLHRADAPTRALDAPPDVTFRAQQTGDDLSGRRGAKLRGGVVTFHVVVTLEVGLDLSVALRCRLQQLQFVLLRSPKADLSADYPLCTLRMH
jgi:hypothetical protein